MKYLAILFLFVWSCSIPKDCHNSWETAKNNEFKIGIIKSNLEESSTYKKEINLLEDFAKMNNLKIKIEKADETTLFNDLSKYKYTVVMGNIRKSSIWNKKATFTKPYDSKHVFAVPHGENKLLYKLEAYLKNHQQ